MLITAFSPLPNQRIPFEVATQIANAIARGTIAPGSQLPGEADLMVQFNVGRNALREAMKILEFFGLIVIQRGHGTYVQHECTFGLIIPLCLKLLWSKPSATELNEFFESLNHARDVCQSGDPEEFGDTIFDKLLVFTRFLFFPRMENQKEALPSLFLARMQGNATASKRVFWDLLEDITCGRLSPGDKLPTESHLIERFGVSRAVIREATKAMEAMGIVEIRRPAGTFIVENGENVGAFIDPLAYGRIFANQNRDQFFQLKLAVRYAVFYSACKKSNQEERERFMAVTQDFIQAMVSPAPDAEVCGLALTRTIDCLREICGNFLLQQAESVIRRVSSHSRSTFVTNTLARGLQQEVADAYLQDARILLYHKTDELPGAMMHKLQLWAMIESD